MPKKISRRRRVQIFRETERMVIPYIILALILLVLIYYKSTRLIGIVLVIPIGLFIAYLIVKRVRVYVKTTNAQEDIDQHIRTALQRMDSIGGSFTDEESATQQLCVLLRELMPGADVRLVRQGSGGMGDIRVGDTIIEGKLDLVTKDEADRLIGQLQDYCSRSSSKIRVVVYGKIQPEFRRRIEGLKEYHDRILLHYLEVPQKRRRRDNGFLEQDSRFR